MKYLIIGMLLISSLAYAEIPKQAQTEETKEKLIELARVDLMKLLAVEKDKITVKSAEKTIWQNSALGYPQEGHYYLQVLTDGYKIILNYSGKDYEYHTNMSSVKINPKVKKNDSSFSYLHDAYSGSGQADYKVILDSSLAEKEGIGAAWLAYGLERILWHKVKFFKEFPREKEYRYTYQEELEARSSLAKVWIELCQTDPTLKDKYLDELSRVYKNSFLKEYVFFYFNRSEWTENENLKMNDFMLWVKRNMPGHKSVTLVVISPVTKQAD